MFEDATLEPADTLQREHPNALTLSRGGLRALHLHLWKRHRMRLMFVRELIGLRERERISAACTWLVEVSRGASSNKSSCIQAKSLLFKQSMSLSVICCALAGYLRGHPDLCSSEPYSVFLFMGHISCEGGIRYDRSGHKIKQKMTLPLTEARNDSSLRFTRSVWLP